MPDLYESEAMPMEGGTAERVERVEIRASDGVLVYLASHSSPMRGLPTSEAVKAICIVKRLARSYASVTSIIAPRRTWRTFMSLSTYIMRGHVIRHEHMQPCSRELRTLLSPLGPDAAAIISHVIEYDSAYRVRFQDMLSHTTLKDIKDKPIRTLLHLLTVNRRYDYHGVHIKVRLLILTLCTLLLLPPVRRQWRHSFSTCNWEALLPTAIDHYWAALRTDYGPQNQNNPANLRARGRTTI